MSKYFATYKCPLCGVTIRYGEPQEIPYDSLPDLLAKIVSNHQQFYGHPVLYKSPLYIPHKCPNGDAGLAAFSGFTKADKLPNR